MVAKLKSSTWLDFSERVVRIFQLPNGTEVRLYRKRDGRRVRSDTLVKRMHVVWKNISLLKEDDKSSAVLREAKMLLSTDIDARGWEMQLWGPQGQHITGNWLIGTVRKLPPSVSEDDAEPLELFLKLLENAGVDDISLRQAGVLYRKLRKTFGSDFDTQLLIKRNDIENDQID